MTERSGHTREPRLPNRTRRPSLYRSVLSVLAASMLAVWLAFSMFYLNALNKHAQATASSKPAAQTAPASSAGAPQAVRSVTTRTS